MIATDLAPARQSASLEERVWSVLRQSCGLRPDRIQMGLMLVAPHPAMVRRAIDTYRRELDRNPVEFVKAHREALEWEVAAAAARYLEADPDEIALTDSTTMGLGLLYSGFKLKPDDDVLSGNHAHYSSDTALQSAVDSVGAQLRRVSFYRNPAQASVDKILSRLKAAILPSTRLVTATYVHSGTGVKMPIAEMSAVIQELNRRRDERNRIYFAVDAVHAFGVEDFTAEQLGCDFLAAGTHKWLFGPRGTGILWAKRDAWSMVRPIVPAFSRAFDMWMDIAPQEELSFFERISPGGFHAFEHRWALKEAFELHLSIGKASIQQRTHHLNRLLKEGLREVPGLDLLTPFAEERSSGMVCFHLARVGPREVVKRLLDRGIVTAIAPYKEMCARLSPCILNTEAEVHRCIDAVGEIARTHG